MNATLLRTYQRKGGTHSKRHKKIDIRFRVSSRRCRLTNISAMFENFCITERPHTPFKSTALPSWSKPKSSPKQYAVILTLILLRLWFWNNRIVIVLRKSQYQFQKSRQRRCRSFKLALCCSIWPQLFFFFFTFSHIDCTSGRELFHIYFQLVYYELIGFHHAKFETYTFGWLHAGHPYHV